MLTQTNPIQERIKEMMVKYNVLKQLRRVLMDTTGKNRETKYWALQLAHQLALSDSLQALLIKKGFIQLFAKLAKQYSGTALFQRLALHSVVRLLASVEYTGKYGVSHL